MGGTIQKEKKEEDPSIPYKGGISNLTSTIGSNSVVVMVLSLQSGGPGFNSPVK